MKLESNHLQLACAPGLLLALTSVVGLAGCASKQPVVTWTPQAEVRWSDLVSRPVAPPNSGYRLASRPHDPGMFPASIAVARVAIVDDKDIELLEHPKLIRNPKNEFLQWNTALDDQLAVSELFPIANWDLGGGPVSTAQILASFRALGAQLGLIYAMNRPTADDSELLGVLYDVRTNEPIALLRSEATSTVTNEEAEESKEPIDYWKTDSRALARAEFALHLHDCIRNLIVDDNPVPSAMPASWRSHGRRRTVEWPPTERKRKSSIRSKAN